MCDLVRYHGTKSMIGFSTILCVSDELHNFKVVFLINRTSLWQEFMMHHAIAIEENSEQNHHILPNLTFFWRPWLFRMLTLGRLGFGLNTIMIRHQL